MDSSDHLGLVGDPEHSLGHLTNSITSRIWQPWAHPISLDSVEDAGRLPFGISVAWDPAPHRGQAARYHTGRQRQVPGYERLYQEQTLSPPLTWTPMAKHGPHTEAQFYKIADQKTVVPATQMSFKYLKMKPL